MTSLKIAKPGPSVSYNKEFNQRPILPMPTILDLQRVHVQNVLHKTILPELEEGRLPKYHDEAVKKGCRC